MQSYELLNSKGRKPILKAIEDQWGCSTDFLKEYAFYLTNKGRVFITTKEAAEFELKVDIRKYSFGNYFGVLEEHGIRLSLEGSQLIGPVAKKNIVQFKEDKIQDWISGVDLPPEENCKGYVIIQYDGHFIGCGKNTDSKLMNFIPKSRRIINYTTCETC